MQVFVREDPIAEVSSQALEQEGLTAGVDGLLGQDFHLGTVWREAEGFGNRLAGVETIAGDQFETAGLPRAA